MRFVKGNLLEATEPLIAHGCNAQGVMGSGVAKYVREKWPKAYEDYHDWCERHSVGREELLGKNRYFSINKNQTLVNAITQVNYGQGKQARYIAVIECLVTAAVDYERLDPNLEIAIPLIGCGLGGLKWEVLKELLEEVEEKYNFGFVVYEL